jgi:hypothetical protein
MIPYDDINYGCIRRPFFEQEKNDAASMQQKYLNYLKDRPRH